MKVVGQDRAIAAALARAEAHSPFLAMLISREPTLVATIAAGEFAIEAGDLAGIADAPVARRLRLARRRLALTVAIGDLAGVLDLTAVTGALTAFADHALDIAIRAAISERTPDAPPIALPRSRWANRAVASSIIRRISIRS